MTQFSINDYDNFFEAVLKLKDVDECRKFFADVCTIKEIEAISQRVEVAKLLTEGKNYQEIMKCTGASTATISRVSRCLNYGSGGYDIIFENKEEER